MSTFKSHLLAVGGKYIRYPMADPADMNVCMNADPHEDAVVTAVNCFIDDG